MDIVKFSVKNSVLVNLLMASVLVMGTVAVFDLPQELMPNIDFHWVIAITTYSGASPEEVENLVTIPVEDAINDVDRVDQIISTSVEGMSSVFVKFETMGDDEYDKLFQDLKNSVDEIDDLPDDLEQTIYLELTTSEMSPVLNVNISGNLPEKELLRISRDLRKEILDIDGVAKADIAGLREREIWVEVDPDRLYRYNISLPTVISSIAMKNMNMPGGKMDVGRAEYLLRTIGEIDEVEQLENVVIRKSIDSGQVKVRDIATVVDTLEESTMLSRLDGAPSLSITVSKTAEGHITEVAKDIRELVAQRQQTLPEGVELVITNDTSIIVTDILNVLKSNAYIGLLMVLVILWLFLGWRNASFAALGIPITFMAAFIFMQLKGGTLNGQALFGFVLVLGIVVDDAIIVVENCFRYIQKGYSPIKAAIVGTREVMVPVLSATATTVAAFMPLMLVPGIMGEFMKEIPITVCIVLAASMVEAFIILPAHVSEWSPKNYRPNKTRFAFFLKLRKKYIRTLIKVLRKRHYAIGGVTLLFFVCIFLVVGYLGVDLYSDDELSMFFVRVWMPEGTALEESDRVMSELENRAISVLPGEDVSAVLTYTGLVQTDTDWVFKPSVGQLWIELVYRHEREHDIEHYMDILRENTKDITGPRSVEFAKMNTGPPTGAAVEVKVKGDDYDMLQVIANDIKNYLATVEGVTDIKDDFEYGKKELKIKVDEDRAALYGFDIFQVSSSVRTAFDGTVASKIRRGDEEIDVVVRYKESDRNGIEAFEEMKIVSQTGSVVPLKDIVEYTVEPGYTSIRRIDRERTISVTADVDQMKANANAISREILERYNDIAVRFPGYSISMGGEFEEFNDSVNALWKLFLLGIFIMYIILGGQFKSFIQPLMILYTIPFGFIGAIMGLMIINSPFSFTTMYGVVALSGIVVNDALVLISFINDQRQRDISRWRSIISGGSIRLRPIILTSVTTIFGMLPMALGIGGESKTWEPLAMTIVGGLFFSTFFTLFLIPCLYAAVDDVKLFFGVKSFKPVPHLEEIEAV